MTDREKWETVSHELEMSLEDLLTFVLESVSPKRRNPADVLEMVSNIRNEEMSWI